MKKILIFSLLTTVFFWGACNKNDSASKVKESKTDERAVLRKEVMDIHDYAMAKLGMLTEMELKITEAVDSTSQEELQEATVNIRALRQADEDMMDWMRQYKDPLETTALDSVKRYFDEQKISIQKVKEDTDNSLEQAKSFLKKIN